MRNEHGTERASSSTRSGGSKTRWAVAALLGILSVGFGGCCAREVLPDPTLPSLPPGRPQDLTQELDRRISGWSAMTIASVDTSTGTVTLAPAGEDTPRSRIVVLAPLPDMEAVFADRARHVAYEEALVRAGRWRE